MSRKTPSGLHAENRRLRAQLEDLKRRHDEAEQAVEAIRAGQVESVVVDGPEGVRIFSLEGAEHAYRVLVEAMNEGAATLASDGTILYCNSRFAEMLGTRLERVMGDGIGRFLPERSRHAFDALVREANGGESRGEIALLGAGGVEFPAYVSASVLHDDDRQRICLIATDLRAQKRNEEIVAAERLARSVLEQAAEAIVVCDDQGRIVRASRTALELSGRNSLLESFDAAFPVTLESTEPGALGGVANRALRGEVLRGAPAWLERGDGAKAYLVVSATPLRGNDESIIGCVITMTDITQRKRSELALSESAAELELALRSAHMGVWRWDIVADRRSFDLAACRMLGLDPASFGGTTEEFVRVIHPDDREVVHAAFASIIADDQPCDPDFRVSWPDGSTHHVRVRGRLGGGEAACPVQVSGVVWDVTERKQAEEETASLQGQLLQAQKMESVGRLAGGVAHDFNNMLGVIIGHAELALEQVDPTLPLHADLEEIHKAASRSAELTRQLLAFARKQLVAPKVVDLNDTLAGMLKLLQRLIGENIRLVWRPGAALWPIRVDPSQVDQILANLCVNARDAISGVGVLTIETRNATFGRAHRVSHPEVSPGDYVALTVSDDGCGMDEETKEHLFEPFFTTKLLGHGTGLGLATVYGIVQQNRGFIDVQSEPGHGATFTVYLPRHTDVAAREGLAPASSAMPVGSETVLVVEDQAAILRLTARMLRLQGYTVLMATTPAEAMATAQEHGGTIDLLLTDVVMPEMNGRELAAQLCTKFPQLKCLFMSGYTAAALGQHDELRQGLRFLQKPFSRDALVAKVREVLDTESPIVDHAPVTAPRG